MQIKVQPKTPRKRSTQRTEKDRTVRLKNNATHNQQCESISNVQHPVYTLAKQVVANFEQNKPVQPHSALQLGIFKALCQSFFSCHLQYDKSLQVFSQYMKSSYGTSAVQNMRSFGVPIPSPRSTALKYTAQFDFTELLPHAIQYYKQCNVEISEVCPMEGWI